MQILVVRRRFGKARVIVGDEIRDEVNRIEKKNPNWLILLSRYRLRLFLNGANRLCLR